MTLETLVAAGSLGAGNADSLRVKLNVAQKLLIKGDPATAIHVVKAFRHEVESLIDEGVLGKEEGDDLLEAADAILAGIFRRVNA